MAVIPTGIVQTGTPTKKPNIANGITATQGENKLVETISRHFLVNNGAGPQTMTCGSDNSFLLSADAFVSIPAEHGVSFTPSNDFIISMDYKYVFVDGLRQAVMCSPVGTTTTTDYNIYMQNNTFYITGQKRNPTSEMIPLTPFGITFQDLAWHKIEITRTSNIRRIKIDNITIDTRYDNNAWGAINGFTTINLYFGFTQGLGVSKHQAYYRNVVIKTLIPVVIVPPPVNPNLALLLHGTTIGLDSSGYNATPTTIGSVTSVAGGKFSNAMSFGANSYISYPYTSQFNTQNSFMVDFWFQHKTPGAINANGVFEIGSFNICITAVNSTNILIAIKDGTYSFNVNYNRVAYNAKNYIDIKSITKTIRTIINGVVTYPIKKIIYIYVDGKRIFVNTTALPQTQSPLIVTVGKANNLYAPDILIDELHFQTNAVSLTSTTYTAPTAPYLP